MNTTALLDELQAIHDEHGTLTAALVVDTARDPDHPLHSRFDWVDSIAAERWRLQQAGALLRVVRLPPEEGRPQDLRAYVSIKRADAHSSEYMPTQVALLDPFTRTLVLTTMEREWRALKRRYQHMDEFAALIVRDIGVERDADVVVPR